jgi:uncharacterized protein (TIGR00730 family)
MVQHPLPHPDKKRLSICVFCGSSYGVDPVFAATAKRLGEGIAASGHSLLFGGGNVGLMGEVARAARDGGAQVFGIIPDFLQLVEPPLVANEKVIVTADLQTRKNLMLTQADAFVVLPGGLGTMDEFFEVLTSAQLGVFAKPIIVVDVAGYFAPLQSLVEHLIRNGFVRKEALALQHIVPSADAAIETFNRLLVSAQTV